MIEDKLSQIEDDFFSPSDDAATSISTGMNETLDSDSIPLNRMPLLNYFRIEGSSIPVYDPGTRMIENRIQEQIFTCAAMAQVMVGTSGPTPPSSEGVGGVASTLGTSDSDNHHLLNSDLWKRPYHVIAFGLKDGQIRFRSAFGGALLIHEETFKIVGVQSNNYGPPVVDIAFDSSGTALVAIDKDKNVCMWELKYSVSFQQHVSHDVELLSQSSAEGVPECADSHSKLLPFLSVCSVAVSRSKYPISWAKPTCISIDPAHRRNREKSFITGFQDGRLVLTRRGGLFQRRNDTIVYHGTPDASVDATNYRGIECLAWRGSFVAWADAHGIKLLDVQSLTRIAHIDRPSGARPALYPSVSSLQPTLVFERSHSLLVSWGDCLMAIEIEDSKEPGSDNKKRSVECSMAWELDCVSCGVSALDKDYVIVLGLVPLEDNNIASLEGIDRGNDVEVQILSRADGAVIYCDSLLAQGSNTSNETLGEATESVAFLKLLSSFALPKMEDSIEADEQKRFISTGRDTSLLFGYTLGEAKNNRFQDAHLQWTLKCDNDEEENITYFDEETGSVDSDDYAFILRPEADSSWQTNKERSAGVPPIMVIVTPTDIICTQTSTVDDTISHALSRNMNALALKYALRHKQELRRHNIIDLVDKFLQSVLRLRPEGKLDTVVGSMSLRQLSLRRMQIALQSMPILLGERATRWEKWIDKLDTIPGVIFLLRDNLPARGKYLITKVAGVQYQRLTKCTIFCTQIPFCHRWFTRASC